MAGSIAAVIPGERHREDIDTATVLPGGLTDTTCE